jgi:hypothetical protein
MVAGAGVESHGFGLVAAGFEANDPITAVRRDFFESSQDGSAETAATMAVAHIHALQFDDAFFVHGPKRAASHRDVFEASDQKHSACRAEIRGVDALDLEAGIPGVEITIERGDENRGFGRGWIDLGQYHGAPLLDCELLSSHGGWDTTIRQGNRSWFPQVGSQPKRICDGAVIRKRS